jgi:mannose-1-phosphate guanylyltransferase/mannose-6-phosphate isomerase
MRYAEIIGEGGVATRLWPMSREALRKQWIPCLVAKCLLQLAAEQMAGVVPRDRLLTCAAQRHEAVIRPRCRNLDRSSFLENPVGGIR